MCSALHAACHYGHLAVVKLLLAHPGIDCNMKDANGETPLARATGHLAIVQRLLRHPGVRTDLTDSMERTVLHTACWRGQHEVVSLLLAHPGVDLFARMKDSGFQDSRTPLMVAVERGEVDCVRVMVEKLRQLPGREALDIDIDRVENYSTVLLKNGLDGWRENVEALVEALKIVLNAQKDKRNEMENKRNERKQNKEDVIRQMGTGKGRNARRRRKQVTVNEEKEANGEENEKELKSSKPEEKTFSEKDETLMKEALEKKEREAAEDTKLDNDSLNQKIKELFILSKDIKEFDVSDTMHNKALLDYDSQIREIEMKKSKTLEDQKKNLAKKKKVEHEHNILEQYIEQTKKSNKEKSERLMEDIKMLKEKLYNFGRKTGELAPKNSEEFSCETVDRRLEEFIERQVAALEEELECPVCLEVATTSPIYKCADDHLICPGCRPKVARCPQCRETYPRGEFRRFRGAERQAERLVALRAERQQILERGGV